MTDIIIGPRSHACFDFVDSNGERRKVTYILSPIRIAWEKEALVIGWACSKGDCCCNEFCRYAKEKLELPIERINVDD